MTSRLLAASVSAVILGAAPLAQGRPDFSGTWTMDPERSESAAQGLPYQPVTVVIRQTATELAIETTRGTVTSRTAYKISTAPVTTLGVDGAPTGRAHWNGDALVTEGTRLVQGQTVSVREARTLGAGGNEMMVDSILMVQHGYEFRGARSYGSGRDVYTRKAP
jgi:hypothetical protein